MGQYVQNPDGTHSQQSVLTGSNVIQTQRMAYQITELVELTIPTYDGSGQGTHPSVVYIPDGFGGYQYWMAFTPYTNGNDDTENPSIIASNNGIDWVVPAGVTNPLFGPPANPSWYADVELVYNFQKNKLMLYWSHFGSGSDKSNYTESSDGVTWSAPVAINLAFGAVGIQHLDKDLFVSHQGIAYGENNGIIKRTSTDGLTWSTPVSSVTNIFGGNHFHISSMLDNSGFHFLSVAQGVRTHDNGSKRLFDLFYGYSIDGDFIVFDSSPLVQRGGTKWTSRRIYRSTMVNIGNNKYRAYVAAESLDRKWHIGYCDFVINNPSQSLMIAQTNYNTKQYYKPDFVDLTPIALAIRDTTEVTLSTNPQQWQKHKNKALMVVSSLDQPAELRLTADWGGAGTMYYGTAKTAQKITIPIGSGFEPIFITQDEMKALGAILPTQITIRIKCPISPTAGAISVKLSSWN